MKEISYEEALKMARKKVIQKYGTITNFAQEVQSGKVNIKYRNKNGRVPDKEKVQQYLSYVKGEKAGKSFPFLKDVLNLFEVRIKQESEVQVNKKTKIFLLE